MSKLVLNAIVVVGALVLGVGAGAGWWFTVGQATTASAQLDGTSSELSSSSMGDGRFHADDLDQFLLTESQTAAAAPTGFVVAVDRSITAPWCGGRTCEPILLPGCDALISTMDTEVIEPVALTGQIITGGEHGAEVSKLSARFTAMVYATPEHARVEFERVTEAARLCGSSPEGGAAITQDEVVGEVAVRSGHLLKDTMSGTEGAGWAISLRGNVVLSLGSWPDKPIRPEFTAPVVSHIVDNANAAVPGASR